MKTFGSIKHDTSLELLPVKNKSYDTSSAQSAAALLDNTDVSQPALRSAFRRIAPQQSKAAWRFMVKSGALASVIIFGINLITLIVVYSRFGVQESVSIVFEGSCTTSNRVTIASHVIINVLSTILLAYSNYGMQCMSAPTRSEIDKAHSRRRWLSVGTPNVRNLFLVSKIKLLLWLSLGISSFPLHLLWNSTVFQTQMSVGYLAISVTPDFLHGGAWSVTNSSTSTSTAPTLKRLQDLAMNNSTLSNLQYLSDKSCIEAYGVDVQSAYRNVLLVVDPINVTTSSNNSVLAVYNSYQTSESNTDLSNSFSFLWMCDSSYDSNAVFNGGAWTCPDQLLTNLKKGNSWIPGTSPTAAVVYGAQAGNPVLYCYAEKLDPDRDQRCKVNIVPVFLIVVMVCNLIKTVTFLASLHVTQKGHPLVTTGDAIQSFLERPDTFTKGRCLAAKYDYDTRSFRRSKEWQPRSEAVFDIWDGGRYRWGKAMRARQWVFYMLCVSTAIILAGSFYGPNGLGDGTTESWPSVLNLGLGKPHPDYALAFTTVDILSGFLSANSPQLIVSYLYLGLSNMLTTMLAMYEWTGFAQSAKGLRVSSPHENTAQRSTYFLSLPYRYAIPMTISVTVLHYFVSEMVFLARLEAYDYDGQFDTNYSTTNIFFSPLAMLLAVSLASAIVLVLIVIGIFRRYPGNIPLAGCCSASIAAACQPGLDEEFFEQDLASKKLTWGVVEYNGANGGHATFVPQSAMSEGLMMGCLYR